LVRGEEVRGGGSTGAGGRRRLFTAEAALRRVGAVVSGIGRISEPRGTRSRGWLGSREDRGGGSAWRPWAAALMAGDGGSRRRRWPGLALAAGRGVEGEVESLLAKQMEGRREGRGARREKADSARRRRGGSASILGVRAGNGDAWRGREASGMNRGRTR